MVLPVWAWRPSRRAPCRWWATRPGLERLVERMRGTRPHTMVPSASDHFWADWLPSGGATGGRSWPARSAQRSAPYAVGGVLAGCVATALLPHVTETGSLLAVIAAYGVVSGSAGVAIGVALAGATPPAARGVVMGGYSTALYLGLAVGSFAFGPVITRYGYATGFGLGAVVGAVGALIAAVLWTKAPHDVRELLTA